MDHFKWKHKAITILRSPLLSYNLINVFRTMKNWTRRLEEEISFFFVSLLLKFYFFSLFLFSTLDGKKKIILRRNIWHFKSEKGKRPFSNDEEEKKSLEFLFALMLRKKIIYKNDFKQSRHVPCTGKFSPSFSLLKNAFLWFKFS